MRLHRITYIQAGVSRQAFASSDDSASKRITELRKEKDIPEKPTREPVDIPTDKAGLIEWLNKNAGVVEDFPA